LKRTRNAIIALLVSLPILCGPGVAHAGVHQVWDEAHLFKAETLLEVEPILQEIDAKFYKDLMIETFPSIPDDFKKYYQQKGKDKFFEDWAVSEGRTIKTNGIVILISADPRHVQIALGLDTARKAFKESDREELVTKITSAFSKGNYDQGLITAAEFVRDRMARNLAEPAASRPSTGPTTLPATTSPAELSK
jgi:uncharacterized membrane protein YgcG